MTRADFLAALRAHLRGVTPKAIDDIVADYDSHFTEGEAAGRSEAEIADALGDPTRLARELRAAAGLKRWDEERSAGAAAGAIVAIIGLGAIDALLLLPVLIVACSVMLALILVGACLLLAGLVAVAASPFAGEDVLPALLSGVGLAAAGVSLCSLQALVGIGGADLLIRYGRFHLRLLRPGLGPSRRTS